jgi:DNA-binding SARP family transcriptional activator/TolB-like protein
MPDSHQPHAPKLFRLALLGGAALLDGRGVVVGEQRRRLALLALVACAGDRGIARDKLIACLSPESPAESARHALHQLLYYLRQQVGDTLFLGTDPLRLNAEVVVSDVQAFERALAEGDLSGAVAIYRGPFLEGFHLPESAEFEEWAAQERSRLAARHADALRSLASSAHASGDFPAAVEWWRQLVRVDPLSGRTALGFLRSLAEAGDVPGALQHGRVHQAMLQESLGCDLDPEVAAFLTRLQNGWKPTPRAEAGVAQAPAPAPLPVPAVPPARRMLKARNFLYAGSIGALIILALAAVLAPRSRASRALQPGLTAVLPFRVSTGDSTDSWLREGMVELLAIRLAGPGGMPVVSPGRLLGIWNRVVVQTDAGPENDAIARVAREVTATRVIDGSVSVSGDRLLVTAWVQSVPGGEPLLQASAEGSRDSLASLVDQLAARLLGQASNVADDRLASLTSSSLPALRAFLAGRADLARGRFREAMRWFDEAILLDTTFALAGLELVRIRFLTGLRDNASAGLRVAHRNRDRLAPADRALLDVLTNQYQTTSDLFTRWNTVVQAYPDRPESWYGLGDAYFHWGRLAGFDGPFERAEDAFLRGWQLDSSTIGHRRSPQPQLVAEPIMHMVELAHLRGDTARVRTLVNRVLVAGPTDEVMQVVRWHLAVLEGERSEAAFWQRMENGAEQLSSKIVLFMQGSGIGGDYYDQAMLFNLRKERLQRPGLIPFVARMYHMNRGRPAEAPSDPDVPGYPDREGIRNRIHDALFWSGDSLKAAQAVSALATYVDAPPFSGRAATPQYMDICATGLWYASRGDHRKAGVARDRLATAPDPAGIEPGDLAGFRRHAELCAALLETWRAVESRSVDAPARLARTDSLARENIFEVCCGEAVTEANLVLAILWERQGDLAAALKAIQRGSGGFGLGSQFLTRLLQEEGRLAAMLGDTLSAVRAYRHYLMFRADPAPELRPEAAAVRAALARITPDSSSVRSARHGASQPLAGDRTSMLPR